MNSYTKNIVALSLFLTLLFSGVVSAQQDDTAPKVFGGRSQYRTWSLGLNAGALSPSTIFGGTKDFPKSELNIGYGLTLRKQLAHSFGLEGSFLSGKLSGTNTDPNANAAFETSLKWTASLMGVVNVATVDFLKRENAVNFLVKAGYGTSSYTYNTTNNLNAVSAESEKHKESFIPVGVGVKFRVSNRINFDMGYNTYFTNTDDLDGTAAGGRDAWSYTYGGLEFSLGRASKANLDWANPVALMYDELKDPKLREEIEALKGRVSTLEAADLLKDTDGDGVADKLDKCSNTEAGIKVDGSGCPLDSDADGVPDSKDSCPTEKGTAEYNGCPGTMASSNAILFEFNSSVLKTSSYAALDELANSLKNASDKKVELDGHASEEGTAEYNMQLSKDRANAVKTYLVNAGVPSGKIITKGFGETRPVASNSTEEGRQQNRRVEIVRP